MSIPLKNVGLIAEEKPSHIFRGYGMYVPALFGGNKNINPSLRKRLENKIFNELGVKVVHHCFEMCYPEWRPQARRFKKGQDHLNPYVTEELDKWIEEHIENLGYGGRDFTEDMKKHGAVYAMNLCCFEPHNQSKETLAQIYAGANEETLAIVRGNGANSAIVADGVHPIADEHLSTYVDKAVNLVERMIKAFGMPVKYISICDEPNFGAVTPHQMCKMIKLARQRLDKKGLTDVQINGPASAGINFAYANAIRQIDSEAFDIYDKITIHSFGSGMMDIPHREEARALGKELWISSTGASGDGTYNELPRNEKGELYDNNDVSGVVNAGAVMIDVNLGASYMGAWFGLFSTLNLNMPIQYHMLLIDKTEEKSLLGKDLLVTRMYEYISSVFTAIGENAEIYYCESSEEGCMTERNDLTNAINNQMAALVGKNTDGKFGIALLNKTDTETRMKELSKLYENTKSHNLAGHSVTLNVELDIKPLYGSGERKFSLLRTGKNGKYLEMGEKIVLTDGKGTVRVEPFELIALREA